jgi:hypothetical protein
LTSMIMIMHYRTRCQFQDSPSVSR